jgi:hypothetical protein
MRRFSGPRHVRPSAGQRAALCSLTARVRKTHDEAELAAIEESTPSFMLNRRGPPTVKGAHRKPTP